jgi:hypothetical protein
MRWSVLVSSVLVGLTACGSADAPSHDPTASSPTASLSSPTTSSEPVAAFTRAGCPVADDEFCDVATRIGRALLDRDAAALLRLSRSDTIECAQVAREYFPGCAEAEMLTGHGLSGADFVVDIVPRPSYARRLDVVISGIEPGFSDELGGGSASVIGVGTCGPDIPQRRTYHVAWTAAIDDGSGPERHLGSFEVGFDGTDWKVILWYLDTLDAWEAEHPDPMALSFCEAGLHPWGV